jgi:hypothetical protein
MAPSRQLALHDRIDRLHEELEMLLATKINKSAKTVYDRHYEAYKWFQDNATNFKIGDMPDWEDF